MTALGLFMHVRRLGDRSGRAAPLALPVWPVVVLALVLWSAACCSGAGTPPKDEAPKAGAPDVPSEAQWLGRSRAEVVDTLGKPLSALQRGDTEILMYAKNVRFDVRDGKVVAFRSGTGPSIVISDGTRYNATDRGKVERVVPSEAKPAGEVEAKPVVVARVVVPTASTPPAPAPESASIDHEEDFATPDDESDVDVGSSAEAVSVGENDDLTHPISEAIEELSNRGMAVVPGMENEREEPRAKRIGIGVLNALLRFGFAVLLLRVAISWVDLPCYLPDVMKVAAFYVVVREGMHGMANMGGHWEWIQLFRLDDVVSFFALSCLLVKFKVALSGLTALKIAVMTKGVTYFLMLMVGVVLSFMMG